MFRESKAIKIGEYLKKHAILIAFVLVMVNGRIGYFFAPWDMVLTPFVLLNATTLIALVTDLKIIKKALFVFLFMVINDVLMNLYTGGDNDSEGMAWLFVSSCIGLVPTLHILCVAAYRARNEAVIKRLAAVGILLLLITIWLVAHFYLYDIKYGSRSFSN